MKILQILCLLAIALLVGCSSGKQAEPDVPTKGQAKGEEQKKVDGRTAVELIELVRNNYREAQFYMDNAMYQERIALKDEATPYLAPPHVVSVVFARPNKFRIARQVPETDAPGLTVTTVCDGLAQRSIISDLAEQALEQPAPDPLTLESIASDKVLRAELFPVPIANLFPQLDLLLADDNDDALSGSDYVYLDEKELDSGPCHRVQFTTPEGPRVAWIDQASQLLRRLDLPSEAARKFRDPEGSFRMYELWIDFHDVSTQVTIPDEVFAFQMPEGATVVDELTRPMTALKSEGDASTSDADSSDEGS